MGGVCNPVSRKKKKKKHTDYSQTLLILNRLSSESNEPKPICHWSQAQCLFTTQSHWSPWNYQLNILFRDLQNYTQQQTHQNHPISYFCPKLTLKNWEAKFKKICMPYKSHGKNHNACHLRRKKLKYSQVQKNLNKTVLYFSLSLKNEAFKWKIKMILLAF